MSVDLSWPNKKSDGVVVHFRDKDGRAVDALIGLCQAGPDITPEFISNHDDELATISLYKDSLNSLKSGGISSLECILCVTECLR
jgi:hypothetical protein